jgi:tRNA modification GTPase
VADEVVVAVKQAAPVPWVEVHSHGGRQVVRFLTELLLAQGLQLCSWQEFLRWASDSVLSAMAAAALAQAPTQRTAAILLDQHAGVLGQTLHACLQVLDAGDTGAAHKVLDDLCRHCTVGHHLTRPWRVVVAGAANVGKSSLVNALAGYQRSIVSPTPGTTRDMVTVLLALDGWPVEVTDTAGLRTSGGALEEEGMRRARATAAVADLCLWVLDANTEPVWPDAAPGTLRLVVNKIDLPSAWDLQRAAGALRVSAKTGEGLGALCQALAGWLVPNPPAPGAAVPFTEALCSDFERARDLLSAGDAAAARRIVAGLQ